MYVACNVESARWALDDVADVVLAALCSGRQIAMMQLLSDSILWQFTLVTTVLTTRPAKGVTGQMAQ